jgi:small subunit ribosomal protein S20
VRIGAIYPIILCETLHAIEKGQTADVAGLLEQAQSLLHKAASRGLIHRNTASRKVARLTAFVRTKVQA